MKEIDLSGIYIQDIKNFMLAAQSQNFSVVAREYGITPSAVSKSISRLEIATDLILFTRHQGKIRLTPAGRKFMDSLADFTHIFESAASQAHRIQEGITASLTVGIPNQNVMPKLIACFRKLQEKYRNLDFSAGIYDFPTLKNRLMDGSLDVIFTSYFEHKSFENTDIRWKVLSSMPLCVFVPESNPLSRKETLSVADLKTEKFIVHSPSMVPGYLKLISDLCEPYGFMPMIGKYTDSLSSFILALEFGNGILIGDELLKSSFTSSVKCFPLEGTVSGSIIAWDRNKEDNMLKDFIRVLLRQE